MPGRPGRVATLVEEKAGLTHGVALQLTGEEALDYLNNRYIYTTTYRLPQQHIDYHSNMWTTLKIGRLLNV